VTVLGRHHRRRRQYVALAVAGIGVGAIAGVLATRGASHGDPCAGGPARVGAAWNEAARARVNTGLASAPWLSHAIAGLDAHAASWELSYRHVCQATRVRGEQSDTLLDLRMRCLDRALAKMTALTDAFAENAAGADATSRALALSAIGELPSPTLCETLTSLGELALPTERAERARAVEIEHDLDRGWATFALGRYQAVKPIVTTLETSVASLKAPRLRASVLALSAAVESRTGDPKLARERLDEAQLAAAEAEAPELEYEIWARRMRNELFGGEPAKVVEWATFARAAAKRTGRSGAEIDGIVGEAMRGAGRLDAAHELLGRALASTDARRPEQRAVIEMNLGSVELARGDSTTALVTLGRARDRVLTAFGDKHPDLALYDDKLAAAYRARGKLRDALHLHDASVALRTQAFGASDRSVATSLLHRAQTLIEAGELRRAKDDIARALDVRTQVYGANSPRLGEVFAARGDAFSAAGELPEATGAYERARELDPRLDLGARRIAAGETLALDAIPPLAPGESPSVERIAALATRTALLATSGKLDDAKALATTLRARYHPGLDAALASAVAAALIATGDRDGAAMLLAAVIPTLGSEPTRTALRVFLALARSTTTQAAAAARGAISLYQAMPQLDRADHDAMWAISRQ